MRRVPEVIDVWFDSGAMPFAQRHAPFENQALFEATLPADYICEAIDQTRGWFYSLIAISTLLFDRSPYRTVLCLGHIADPRARRCRSRSATSSCRGTSSTATAPTRSAGTS
jgi:isoleucyl-tRNA synthetase